jgi:hypothetical protein
VSLLDVVEAQEEELRDAAELMKSGLCGSCAMTAQSWQTIAVSGGATSRSPCTFAPRAAPMSPPLVAADAPSRLGFAWRARFGATSTTTSSRSGSSGTLSATAAPQGSRRHAPSTQTARGRKVSNPPPLSLHALTPSATNDENKYNHNFSGLYCFCDEPESQTDDMVQCVCCQDWCHMAHFKVRQGGGGIDGCSILSRWTTLRTLYAASARTNTRICVNTTSL